MEDLFTSLHFGHYPKMGLGRSLLSGQRPKMLLGTSLHSGH